MLLLLDIGNTHTHLGLAEGARIVRQRNIKTSGWFDGEAPAEIKKFIGKGSLEGSCFCSVVPAATIQCEAFLETLRIESIVLTAKTVRGIGIDYPKPRSIGADRLANAVAVSARHGSPSVVVDFGTAVTFDVVNQNGDYAGGIIAPGLSAMTDYLHEKTALLPRIKIREPRGVIGKNTKEAMLVGAVRGYRGLIHGLITELKAELKTRKLPVIATGGYAALIARHLPEITAVEPDLTLEGLRLVWQSRKQNPRKAERRH
jgi:type III pantothenate kinase